MTFEPQNDLERSLVRAMGDASWIPQFYRDLADGELFLILDEAPPGRSESVVLQPGQTLSVMAGRSDGREFIPVYSSLPRLEAAAPEGAGYIALDTIGALQMIGGAEVILNPGSEYAKEITPGEVAMLVDGSMWTLTRQMQLAGPTLMQIGQPARYPTELAEILKRLFARYEEVQRGWIAAVGSIERNVRPHIVLFLEMSEPSYDVFADIGIVAELNPVQDPPFEVMPFTTTRSFAGLLQNIPPFYRR